MRKYVISFFTVFIALKVIGQGLVVPEYLRFADIDLRINEAARKQIQEDVDALTQSPVYFEAKVNQARLYFPIIERVFREENLSEDFKYLVIQESALIADAVSVSDAVGFWQFKDFTAVEMGLRVDKYIDERMNIVSSTRAAAKYLKKNNFFFNNWLYALQAYQMGAGGVQKAEDSKYFGAKSMLITKKTYWYVKKYLAHRIAYEYGLRQPGKQPLELVEYTRGVGKDMKDLSSELMVSYESLSTHNKWLRKGRIPDDKIYTVIVPIESGELKENLSGSTYTNDNIIPEPTPPTYSGIENPGAFPKISDSNGLFKKSYGQIKVNNIPGVVFSESLTLESIVIGAGITENDFRRFNEILPHEELVVGQVYYFKKKKGKAKAHYHTVLNEEDLWSISQKYGVRIPKLLKKNRLQNKAGIRPGMVLWLRYIRPENEPVRFKEIAARPIKKEVVSDKRSPATMNFSMSNATEEGVEEEMMAKPIATKEITHIVKEKENFYRIAKSYQMDVMDLANYNNLMIADGLQVGQVLKVKVPVGFELPKDHAPDSIKIEQPIMYQVRSGDTFYSIANQFGITIDILMNLNNKKDSHLTVGERLIVK